MPFQQPIGTKGESVSLVTEECETEARAAAQPVPRHTRKPARAKENRGLPPDVELAKLACTYRKTQAELWPGFVNEATEEEIALMVEDFKARHRGGKFDTESLAELIKRGCKFGGN